MPYKVRLARRTVAQIQGWHLPDKILVEVYLHLREVLPADLEHNLSRESAPFDSSKGMTCHFTRRDRHVRGREHHFLFQVCFSQDEEALCIERGAYEQENDPEESFPGR
jgi:hypothetical protein